MRVTALFMATALLGAPVSASDLLFVSSFDADQLGEPPAVGGQGQPSMLVIPEGSTLLVRAQALELAGKPVVATTSRRFTGVSWGFAPLFDTVEVTFEASVSTFYRGILFDSGNPVRLRLRMQPNGDIEADGRCGVIPLVGTYSPVVPFGVRVRLSPPNGFSVTIDDELDGFGDDTPVAGEYCSTGLVSLILLGAWSFDEEAAGIGAAFDNVEARLLPFFSDAFETGDASAWSSTTP